VALAGASVEARLRDVSAAGLCFYLDRPIAEMTVLAVAFALPGDPRPVQCRGAVVRCARISPALEHYEVAIFLHEISAEDRARVGAFAERAGGS
jgi:hypothetical protein